MLTRWVSSQRWQGQRIVDDPLTASIIVLPATKSQRLQVVRQPDAAFLDVSKSRSAAQ